MPEKKTIAKARKDKRQGKSPGTQAGEFVHEEIEHIREGRHGARSAKQAIAIGLSKARRAGVDVPAAKKATTTAATRRKAAQDSKAGDAPQRKPSPTRSRATKKALKQEPRAAATKTALSRQATNAAKKRTASERSASARKAVRTKGPRARSAAAKKAARTRARRAS